MIFVIVAVVAGLIGGFMAQAKGKDVALWGILCALFPIAILILAFKEDEPRHAAYAPQRPYTASVPPPVEAKPVIVTSRDNPAWKTLKEFDADIQEAVAKLVGFGPQAEERLASAYLSVNDKGLLPSIVAKISADEEKNAVAHEEEKARRAVAMSQRDKELLADRERKAEHTIGLIKEAGMVYDGRKVVSADMYYGATAADQGWVKIVYEDGRTELRAGSSWTLMKS